MRCFHETSNKKTFNHFIGGIEKDQWDAMG